MTDYKNIQDALIAGTLGIGEHGVAVAQESSGQLGYIDDEGAWCPRRLRSGPGLGPVTLENIQLPADRIDRIGAESLTRRSIIAEGEHLDRIASRLGVARCYGEPDELLRERLQDAPAALQSTGWSIGPGWSTDEHPRRRLHSFGGGVYEETGAIYDHGPTEQLTVNQARAHCGFPPLPGSVGETRLSMEEVRNLVRTWGRAAPGARETDGEPRLHSFGWSNGEDAYEELGGFYAPSDGEAVRPFIVDPDGIHVPCSVDDLTRHLALHGQAISGAISQSECSTEESQALQRTWAEAMRRFTARYEPMEDVSGGD